ncbi:MAG: PAS domain S-box protein, partial [Rhodospirillales bacterium]|nr:PAS domain S-box protein [Rhodospirillales bacterium]
MAEAAERKQEAACPNAALQARAEQVRLLYRHPIQLFANVVIAAIVGAVLWKVYLPAPLLAWFGLMVTLLRLGLCRRYDRAQPPPDEAEGWGRLFALGAGVTGGLWGACASAILFVEQMHYHAFIAFVAAGMGAGAVAAGSIYLPAVNAFLWTSLAPLALIFAIEGQLIHLAMGTMVALFGVLMSRVARNLNRSLTDTFKLQADNAVLIEQLSAARNSLELRVQEKTAELGESEERYRRLVELSPAGIFVNLDGKIAFANPAAVGLLGAGADDELVGRQVLDFIHPDFKDAVRSRTEYATQESGTPPPMEQLYVGLDGRVFHVEATATPIVYRGKNAVLSVFRDIGERKRSEQALRESRDQLRLITDNLPVLISYVDKDQRYRFANRLHEKWFERPLAEILGKHANEVLEPSVYERLKPNIEKALEGESQGFEVTTQPTEVPPRHFRVNFVPHIGADGAVQGFFALVRSITRYKAAETAIRESEAQLRLVTDNLPVLISYIDDQQRFRFVNKACETWYGRSEAELLGKRIEEIQSANYDRLRPRIEQVLSGKLTSFDESLKYPDGKFRHVEIIYIPHFDVDRRVLGFFALVQDITGRKRAEEAVRTRDAWLRAILENAPIQIVLKDTEGRIMAISRNVAEILGRAVEDFIGRTTADFLPTEIADIYMTADREVMASGRPLQQEVVEEQDGSATHLLSAKFPLRDERGQIVGICSLTSDITEMKAMQAQLNQAQKMEAVGQLTG